MCEHVDTKSRTLARGSNVTGGDLETYFQWKRLIWEACGVSEANWRLDGNWASSARVELCLKTRKAGAAHILTHSVTSEILVLRELFWRLKVHHITLPEADLFYWCMLSNMLSLPSRSSQSNVVEGGELSASKQIVKVAQWLFLVEGEGKRKKKKMTRLQQLHRKIRVISFL